MPSATIARGNILEHAILSIKLSPASVANATSAEQTFAVRGLRTTDFIDISKPTSQAGLAVVNARVSAKDVLAITFMNCTAATITPTANEFYSMIIKRPENPNSLPSENL